MGTSITAGVAGARLHFPDAAGWLIAPGDMPFVQRKTLARLRDALLDQHELNAANLNPAHSAASIVAPVLRGRRGHPVGFAAQHAAELCALTGDQGARTLLERHAIRLIESDDSGILKDIDNPDDLHADT